MVKRIHIRNKPNVYRWASELKFIVDGSCDLQEVCDGVTLLWKSDVILSLRREDIHPSLSGAGARGYKLLVEATDTACAAEDIGTRIAFGILMLAIEKGFGVSLSSHDQPLPCAVIDRTRGGGMAMRAFATVKSKVSLEALGEALENEVNRKDSRPYSELLSKEMFCASRMEGSNRARLILLISAAEALSEQEDFTARLGDSVDKMVDVIREQQIDDPKLVDSLVGQIRNLCRESARRAVMRMLRMHLTSGDEIARFEEAYDARSKMVHEAKRVPELDKMVTDIDGLMKKVYSKIDER